MSGWRIEGDMRRFVLGLLAIAGCAAVAACESGEQPANRTQIKVVNPIHDQLLRLSSLNQRIALMRAIRDNGRRCPRVDGARYQQDYSGMAMWVALCEDSRYWAVFIAPNGDTQVRNCGDMHQLNLPQCRPVTPAPPEENNVNNL
jgi:hypothetical protein